jgi:hypothetical protein
MQSFYVAVVANNDVEQDHSGFLTLHPIRQPIEWRTAMFADPTHALDRTQRSCHPSSKQFSLENST